eukprot:TRINITY_DN7764_c0_g1_i2.p1 TRINITY_DN7764_c0_g1~~TRINITY_DN7764_c0_g1_i2.p1  ORF type:complete len:420 (+),score=64.34 TRINITY_DN7764_c0_g1_i2:66-1325(+)
MDRETTATRAKVNSFDTEQNGFDTEQHSNSHLPPTLVEQLKQFGVCVQETHDRGRRLISHKQISAGDLVLECFPYVYSVHDPHKKTVCQVCLSYSRTRLPFRCEQCCQVYYCSMECKAIATVEEANSNSQNAAAGSASSESTSSVSTSSASNLPESTSSESTLQESSQSNTLISPTQFQHPSLACTAYSKIPREHSRNEILRSLPIYTSYLRMLIDLYVRRFLTEPKDTLIRPDRDLSALQSCLSAMTPEELQDFDEIARVFLSILPKEISSKLSHEAIIDFISRERCNAFGYVDDANEMVAWGVYTIASFMNHSCYPNAVKYMKGPKLQIFALRDIDPGDEINISYVTLDDSLEERVQVCKDVFFFECDCVRCSFEKEHGPELANQKFRLVLNQLCRCGSYFIKDQCLKCKKVRPVNS